MAKRILVPLDGAAPAEALIAAVADLARGAGATVRLLHVAPVPDSVASEGRVVAYADQEAERRKAEALDYLRGAELGLDGVAVEHGVRFGEPVAEIVKEAEAFDADLIAMFTRSAGFRRVVLGSVAEQVFRKAAPAVVLFRAGREAA